MYCNECGTKLADDALFCPNCGKGVAVSGKPKKKPYVLIGVIGGVACLAVGGFFLLQKPETDVTTAESPPFTESVGAVTEPPKESVPEVEKTVSTLNAGTYANELDRITIAQDVEGMYSFNLTGYDESGDFLLLSGNIDSNNGEYLAVISDDDESGNFVDKSFTITPDGDSVVISSDDDALLFLCAQYQYFSEVDALEADASDFEGEVTGGIEGGGTYENDTDLGALEQIPYIPKSFDMIGMNFESFVEEHGYTALDDKADICRYFWVGIIADDIQVYELYPRQQRILVGVRDGNIVVYLKYLDFDGTMSEYMPLDKMPVPYACITPDSIGVMIWRFDNGYLVVSLAIPDADAVKAGKFNDRLKNGQFNVRSIQFMDDLRYSALYQAGKDSPIDLN